MPISPPEYIGSGTSSSQRTDAKYLPDGVFEMVIDFIVPSISLFFRCTAERERCNLILIPLHLGISSMLSWTEKS